jgi:O-antigen ligase
MISAVLVACFISIETSSRTNIVLVAIVLIIVFIFDIIVNRLPPKVRRRRIGAYFAYFLLIFILILANYKTVLTWYEYTNLFNRIGDNSQLTLQTDGRWEQWYDVIVNMPSYIFGNMPDTIFLAHNLFLDVYRVAGIIPFILIITYIISTINILFKLLRDKRFTNSIKCLLFSIQFLYLLSFMIEPVMEGRPLNFFAYCFINGITVGLLNKSKNLR